MIKTLLKQIREYRRDTIITPIFTVLEVVAELLVPFVIASLIDKGIEAGNLRNVYLYGALMIFLAAIVVLAAAVALIMSKAMKIFSHVFHRYDDLNASVQENISAIRVVKAFVREDYENEKFGKAAAKLYELFVSAEKLQALNLPVMMFIVYGCIIAISWFGARFIVAGSMTTGNLTSLFTYVMTAFSSLMMLSMIFVMMTMSAASGKRIAEVLEEKADITDPSKPLDRVKDGSIDFDHVTFSYRQGSGEETLSDIDLHIRSGETIGIIGGTGCGKSSLVSLISRLYDVTSGCVKVGGEDVRSYDLETLRNQVAVVLQKNVLFSGTVLDNLRWGKKMGHTEEYREACRMACADEFIEHLPKGYDAWVERGGANFSGGQKQWTPLRQLIGQSVPQLVNSTVTIVLTFISMVCLNIPLTILTLCMVAVMLVAASKLGGMAGTYFVKQQSSLGKVNAYIEEMMEGQKVVKVFCHEKENIDQFRAINQELRESTKNANKIATILMPVNGNLGNISYVLCAVLGAVLALNGMGSLTLGTLVSYLNLNRNFTQPVTQVSQQFNSVIMALAGAERIFKLLDEQPEADNGYVELVNVEQQPDGTLTETPRRTGLWAWRHPHKADGTVTYKKLEGDIVFDDVDFGYIDEKIVLHNIKLFATPGQKIAFVGSTGAGKTTITNLINRFYDIQDGKIRYDGININKIRKADLRRSLGIVLQDTHLFTGTVMENIRYGRLVQEGMDRLMKGRTTFVIAHRLSTVRNSDCIMVLEQGRIIERGTHDQLIEEKGRYYQLYTGHAIA